MPEIDNDLFHILSLALLALAVVLLLALLGSLSGIRKVLKEQLSETQELRSSLSAGTGTSAVDAPAPEPAETVDTSRDELPEPEPSQPAPLLGGAAGASSVSDSSDADRGGESLPSQAATPDPWEKEDEPQATPAQPEPEPEDPFAAQTPAADDPFSSAGQSADDPFAARTPDGDPFSSVGQSTEDPFGDQTSDGDDPVAAGASTDEDPFGAGAQTSDEPFAAQTPAEDDNPFVREADEPAPQSTIDEPEEQPFERNGRWFFRRDGELLVYEEGTGEWVPADPADAAPAPTPPPVKNDFADIGAISGSDAGETDEGPDETARFETVEDEPRPAGGGGFWKCASCGAVNGSSAATCRMCFSVRP